MNKVAAGIEKARERVAAKTEKFLPNTCKLITATSVPDGFGGSTETETEVETGINYKYEPLGPSQKTIGGGAITTQTHKLTMGHTETTRAISSHYKIVDEDNADLVFENPVTLDGSFSVFLVVAAELAE